MADSCVVCSKRLTGESLNCTSCRKYFHIQCVQMTETDYACLKEQKLRWKCPACLHTGRTLRSNSLSSAPIADAVSSKLDLLISELSDVKKMQSSIVVDVSMIKKCQATLSDEVNAKYTELSRLLADCVSRVSVHDEALEDCKTSLDKMNSKISNIERSVAEIKASQVRNEADFGISAGSVSCVSEVIDELSEQQKRATNIMVFGARENAGVPKRDRGQVDQRFVVDLFKFLLGDNAPDIKSVFRLGSLQAERTRPLKLSYLQNGASTLSLKMRRN